MKICIPFKPGDVGGTSIFMRKFVEGLMKKGVEVTTDIDDNYELLFVIISYDGFFNKKLQEKKEKGVKIVQRLDGVLTFATSYFFYPLRNFGMKCVHNKIADYIIFQSEYSKFLCDKYLGKPRCDWSIIYNGVDLQKFSPKGDQYHFNTENTLISVCGFRRKVTLWPLIKAMEYIKKEVSDIQLILIGPIKSNLRKLIPPNNSHIKYIGSLPNDKLPFYERGADAFIFPIRSASPNVLLESISCGLPVACYDIGSNREVLGDNEAGALADSGFEKKVWRYYMMMPNPKNMADTVLKVLDDDVQYRKKARERAVKLFSLDKMVNEYLKVFDKVLNNDQPEFNRKSSLYVYNPRIDNGCI